MYIGMITKMPWCTNAQMSLRPYDLMIRCPPPPVVTFLMSCSYLCNSAKFIVPDSGIGLSYRVVVPARQADTTQLCRSQLSPPVRDYESGYWFPKILKLRHRKSHDTKLTWLTIALFCCSLMHINSKLQQHEKTFWTLFAICTIIANGDLKFLWLNIRRI
jgi:hypothetical protein